MLPMTDRTVKRLRNGLIKQSMLCGVNTEFKGQRSKALTDPQTLHLEKGVVKCLSGRNYSNLCHAVDVC